MNRLFVAAVAAIPAFVFALPSGAPAGRSGVEGELTCLACHAGIRLNTGGGNVSVTFPGSYTYYPGVKQRLRVTVNDTVAAEFGFQITARTADAVKQPGGSFELPPSMSAAPAAPGPGQPGGPFGSPLRVTCWSGDLEEDDTPKPASGCPGDKPIETLVQGRPVFSNSTGTATWEFDWLPPAEGAGPVKIYIASNASEDEEHARVYTASYTLNPATSALRPVVSMVGLIPGYGSGTVFSPGTWVVVQGGGLAASTRPWSTTDFTGNTAPSELDSVRVLIGGKQAFLSQVSPARIVAEVPAGVPMGEAPLTVSINGVASAPATLQLAARTPYLGVRNAGGKAYLAASLANGGAAIAPPRGGGPGGGPGGPGGARQAGPGDVITFSGIGFGDTDPNTPPGQRAVAGSRLSNVEIRFADQAAEVRNAALAPNQVGIYQFTVVVPDGLAAGEVPVTVTVDGVKSTQELLLPTR